MTEIPIKNRTHRNIGGVKLIHTGLKGIEITYETIEIQNAVSYTSEDIKKSKRPVHTSLKDLVKELKPYFIELLGYPADSDPYKFEVTGVKAGSDRFVITGMHQCWQDKIVGMPTPLIKEVDEYERYDEVMKVIDSIYKETDLYIQGVRNIKREEVIVDFMKDVRKKSEFDFSDFENMTSEEQEELMKEIEKDTGISVHEENGEMVIAASDEGPAVTGTLVTDEDFKEAMETVKKGYEQFEEEEAFEGDIFDDKQRKIDEENKKIVASVVGKKDKKGEVKPIAKDAPKEEKLKYAKEVEAQTKSKVKNVPQEEEELPVSFDDDFDLPL